MGLVWFSSTVRNGGGGRTLTGDRLVSKVRRAARFSNGITIRALTIVPSSRSGPAAGRGWVKVSVASPLDKNVRLNFPPQSVSGILSGSTPGGCVGADIANLRLNESGCNNPRFPCSFARRFAKLKRLKPLQNRRYSPFGCAKCTIRAEAQERSMNLDQKADRCLVETQPGLLCNRNPVEASWLNSSHTFECLPNVKASPV